MNRAMDNTDQLLENTLYTTPQEREDLLKDKQKVADAFFLNFLGTLSLLAISPKRGRMKSYFQEDGSLQLKNITDINNDASMSVKLFSEVGGIRPDTANKLTRLLVKVKQRQITGKDLDDTLMREMIREIHFMTHRPSQKVLEIVKSFVDGTATLKQVGKAFFYLVKMRKKELMPVAGDFYDIAKGFGMYFKDIDDIGAVVLPKNKAQAIALVRTHPAATAAQTKLAAPVAPPVAPPVAITHPPTPIGKTDAFYNELSLIGQLSAADPIFKKYGVPRNSDIDYAKLSTSIIDNQKEFSSAFNGPMGLIPMREDVYKTMMYYYLGATTNTNAFARLMDVVSNITALSWVLSNGGAVVKSHIESYLTKIVASIHTDSQLPALTDAIHASSVFYRHTTGSFQPPVWQVTTPNPSRADVFAYFVPGIGTKIVMEANLRRIGLDVSRVLKNGKINVKKDEYALFPHAYTEVINAVFKSRLNILPDTSIVQDALAAGFDFPKAVVIMGGSTDAQLAEYLSAVLDFDYSHQYHLNGNALFDLGTTPERLMAISEAMFRAAFKLNRASAFGDILGGIGSRLSPDKVRALGRIIGSKDSLDQIKVCFIAYHEVTYQGTKKTPFTDLVIGIFDSIGARQNFISDLIVKISDRISGWAWFVGYVKNQSLSDDACREICNATVQKLATGYFEHIVDRADGYQTLVKNNPALARFFNDYVGANYNAEQIVFAGYGNSDAKTAAAIVNYIIGDELSDSVVSNVAKYLNGKATDFMPAHANHVMNKKIEYVWNEYLKNSVVPHIIDNMKYSFGYFSTINLGASTFSTLTKRMSEAELRDMCGQFNRSNDGYFGDLHKTIADEGVDTNEIGRVFGIMGEHMLTNKGDFRKPIRDWFYDKGFKMMHTLKDSGQHAKMDEMWRAMGDMKEFKAAFIESIRDVEFFKEAQKQVMGDDVPIKPYADVVDKVDTMTLLAVNGLVTPKTSVKVKKVASASAAIQAGMDEAKSIATIVEPLKTKEVSASQEQLDQASIELDKHNRYRHGDLALKVIRMFDVEIPKQTTMNADWAALHPNATVTDPMYHGTGSIAASMILRYGFKVITKDAAGISTTGKMLGDGIYGSNVTDKVAQYVSDSGYARKVGTRGYFFTMRSQYDVWGATLGWSNVDWSSAGGIHPGEHHSTRSPEWAFRDGNAQLKIYRCFEVEVITKRDMMDLKAKYGANEDSLPTFSNYLNEAKAVETYYDEYVFMDGTIPVAEHSIVSAEDFKAAKFGKHVLLDWGRNGPVVLIKSKNPEKRIIQFTRDFVSDDKVFAEYLKKLKG